MKEFYKNRNKDLLETTVMVLSRYKRNNRPSLSEIAKEVVMSSAPHYYLTFDYALRQVRRARMESDTMSGNSMHRSQIREIVEKVDAVKEKSRRELSDSEALSRVLSGCSASRYFISHAYAVKLIRKLLFGKTKLMYVKPIEK